MRSSRLRLLLLLLLAVGSLGSDVAMEPPARVVAGAGIRILSVDGAATLDTELSLAPGVHRIAFDVGVEAKAPGEDPRPLRETCDARFFARPGARYVLVNELVSVRGAWAWRHLLSSGVLDEERERWVGECVCRNASPDEDGLNAR